MDDILKELKLEALLANFQQERIVPATVPLMNDNELERLGVTAMGDRLRLRRICKEVSAEPSSSSQGNAAVTSQRCSSGTANSVREERRLLFNPRGSSQRSQRSKKKTTHQGRTWTVQFVCLADKYQSKIPTAIEKQRLHKAGLGVKKIKLQLDDDESSVHQKLISGEKDDVGDVMGFPQLLEAGGFEMLHCLPNCRDLTPLKCSWAAREIRSNLGGQSKIYLRPIQKDLSTKSLIPQNVCEVKEKCMSCKREFPMSELRSHTYVCSAGLFSSDSEEENVQSQSYLPPERYVEVISDDPSENIQTKDDSVETPRDVAPDTSAAVKEDGIQDVVRKVIAYCNDNNIQNPVEILRCLQKAVVIGRKLELESDSELIEGDTNYINIDRSNVLQTALDEIGSIENLRLTLEVAFYGELARDYGGPRKEFFRLVLHEIKEKYFDNGIRELLAEDYYVVGKILGLSIVQNGKIPNFFTEDQLNGIFQGRSSFSAIANLQNGLAELGIYQVCKELPILVHIFRPSQAAALTIKKLTHLLKPEFAEDGSNQRTYEGKVYSAFCRYLREVARGGRAGVTLGNILWFTTGSDEEPLLGFKLHPRLSFTDGAASFLPLGNTCINSITLPRPSLNVSLPPDEKLFNLYDYAFLNGYFGNV